MTVDIRRYRTQDADAVRSVVAAAFEDDGRIAGLVEALRGRADRQSGLVAADPDADGGRIVGYTHLSTSWVDAPTRLVEVLTLSPLAVAPSHRSRGIGTTLLTAAVAAADALGSPLVFLEGDPAYYALRGWRRASELGFAPPSTRIPDPAFQVIALSAYDASSMHGALVYNDTFWAFDCVGLRS